MSQTTSFTHENSTPVGKKWNWMAMIISSVIGGVVARLSLFAIAALMPPGEDSFIAGTTVTGIIWGIATKVAGNILGSDRVTFILHQYPIQQSYRKTIEQHIGTKLEDVVTSIRTHNRFELQEKVHFDVDEKFRFDNNEERRLFFGISWKVMPPSGASPRPLHRGVSAPDLPNYDPLSTRMIMTEKKGICHGIQEGALLGLTSGALASLLFLTLGMAGIVLGVTAATILVGRITHSAPPPATPDKTALREEFDDEARHQMSRLMRCADDNGVEWELHMVVWSTTVSPGAVHPTRIFPPNRIV